MVGVDLIVKGGLSKELNEVKEYLTGYWEKSAPGRGRSYSKSLVCSRTLIIGHSEQKEEENMSEK